MSTEVRLDGPRQLATTQAEPNNSKAQAPTYLPVLGQDKASKPKVAGRVSTLSDDLLAVELMPRTRSGEDPFADRLLPKQQPSQQQQVDVYTLDAHGAVPFVRELSHQLALGEHLWIGVQEGIVVVLGDDDHRRLGWLISGVSPASVVERERELRRGVSADEGWASLNQLLARLAEAGFIRGINGNRDVRTAEPHRFARLHLTKRCQLACIHCYADSSPQVDGSNELPPERWMRLIDEIADNGGERVLFTGGEALVYRGCLDLMKHAKRRDLYITLFSNGILVDRHADELKDVVDLVQISIDAPDAPTNDQIRGIGSHRRALRAVQALAARKVPVRIGMTVMELNWRAIREGFVPFAEGFKDLPVQFRMGYGLSHHGRGETVPDSLTVEETRPVVDAMLERVRGPVGPKITRRTSSCGYAEQLVVAPDGVIYPCHLLDGAICHIDDMPLSAVLTRLRGIAGAHEVDHNEGCKSCDIRNLCGGTCRISNRKETGNLLTTTCTTPEKLGRYESLVRQFSVQK
jgi:radical SAM protein with 4Fe4S-binding SPASM domain